VICQGPENTTAGRNLKIAPTTAYRALPERISVYLW